MLLLRIPTPLSPSTKYIFLKKSKMNHSKKKIKMKWRVYETKIVDPEFKKKIVICLKILILIIQVFYRLRKFVKQTKYIIHTLRSIWFVNFYYFQFLLSQFICLFSINQIYIQAIILIILFSIFLYAVYS